MKISVCIVEDSDQIRTALEAIVSMDSRFKLAGSFGNGEDALQKIPKIHPNIVLMDINLGLSINGIECIKMVKEKFDDILFMVCTVYEDDLKVFDALSAGANSYMLKKTSPVKMLEAIRELYEGGAPMSSLIARKVVKAFQQNQVEEPIETERARRAIRKLSTRENEILRLLSSGLLYKEIAAHLEISTETVRKHAYHIYEKLHVTNRVEAINKLFDR